ncbi:acetyl/propionyl-CoA carboxylase subunit alpha [Agromyces luteolus]|uniref:biotin carboxylase n=1 Tax=Agromyces luteolus TaxID=88373 RepID=A0A7C9HGT8_9MICO|nr:biotin carboxylase N-terminal domain-containing protein [Agromyces luteolus]MUN06607.1 ATP-grasp domain-containing protein [Agromyces luteolus]GLK29697.1 acetyl/propionyl-CoA carboxylase subunit alpha [Agromyces luteolus]
MGMFERVLVANRGEIAVRVIRTLKRLGIRAIAVYSDADADAPHVALADEAVRIGPAAAAESYLDPARIVRAALETGAQAIHPGYGFLSENAAFGRACAEAGIVFIGPGELALEVMGDKIRAKRHVEASGVPVVPGVSEPDATDDELLDAAPHVGFPILVKPSAGGGGKGMQVARDQGELEHALPAARRVARAAFGDDTLLLERFVERPRHIEVQVLADAHGNVIHLGERECSLQRRHQKVVEEAPSPLLDAATRERIGAAACDAARSVEYLGAGTVEFLVSDAAPDEFFFIEMNTRLQVEHPVTELVTGVDLVEQQLRIAAGEPLAIAQGDVRLTGHAIEARVYAESPERGFLPATGELLAWRPAAGEGVRVDSGVRAGQHVTADYDPMIAKVIAHGADRAEALDRLDAALADTLLLGVDTNIAFLRTLLAHPDVRAGHLDTGLIDRLPEGGAAGATPVPADAATDAPTTDAAPDPLERVAHDARERDARAAAVGDHAWRSAREWRIGSGGGTAASGPVADLDRASVATAADGTVWVHLDGRTGSFARPDRRAALDARLAQLERGGSADPDLRAPMPGSVTTLLVADGDRVEAGQGVLAIEAMKMEHRVTATVAGVARLRVAVGEQVARDQVVARIDHVTEPAAASPAASGTEPIDGPHEGAVVTASHQE